MFASDFVDTTVRTWLAQLPSDDGGLRQVDVLTSNPPYIPHDEYVGLSRSVRVYEDPRALLGDRDKLPNASPYPSSAVGHGLDFYPRIAALVPQLVRPGGLVALEVGYGQAEAVRKIFAALPAVQRVEIWEDPWKIPRTVVAHLHDKSMIA